MSQINRAFAQAATRVFHDQPHLRASKEVNLGSKIMLQSAPGLRSLILTYQNLADPAAEGFAAAATQLTSLTLHGDGAHGVHTCAR